MKSQKPKLATTGEGYRRTAGLASLPESRPTQTKDMEVFNFVERADTFATKGITAESAATLGMTPAEFTAWSLTQAGHDSIQQAHLRLSSKLDARLTDLMERVTNDLEVRLRDGNKEFNRKTGEWDYVPLTGKDLAIIFSALFDRRQLLRKQPTKITEEDHKLGELTGTLRRIGEANNHRAKSAQIGGPPSTRHRPDAST